MAEQYSSEEEIAWGPLTLKEIKKEFQKQPRKIKRRETDCGPSTPFYTPSTTFTEDKSADDNINSASVASAYFTPDESLAPPSSSTEVFLENIVKTVENQHASPNAICANNDTIMNILLRGKDMKNNILEKIQQTLVENRESDLNIIPTDEVSFEDISSSDVITISSDDSVEEVEEIHEISIPMIKIETVNDTEEQCNISEECDTSDLDLDNLTDENAKKLACLDFDRDTSSKIEDLDVSTSILSTSYSQEDNSGQKIESDLNLEDPIQERNSDIKDVDFSSSPHSSRNESLVFNDTMEEMELALREGLNYVMPDDTTDFQKSSISPISNVQNFKTGSIPRLKKPHTVNKFDYITSPVGDYIRKKSPTHDNFKLPLKPVKSRIAVQKSPLVPTKQFKNIISPVGIYIKNSPGVCLKQNLPVRTVPSFKPPTKIELFKENKENNSDTLPEVVYKPGKKVVMNVQKDIVLPCNIQKMVHEPVILKHEGRIQGNVNKNGVSQKLLDGNLTRVDNSSVLNQSEDISFITEKQAFIK